MEKRRILIIDDEQGLLRTLKLGLEDTGVYEVRIEEQAREGLSAAIEFQPDMILVDVMMPEMDGGDVVAQLKSNHEVKDVPVVFLTAIAQQSEIEAQGGAISGYPCIAKPVGVKGVLEYLDRHLGL